MVLRASSGKTTIRQQFRLQVVGATGNRPPVVAPVAVPAAYVGQSFSIDLDGFDPEGTPITFFALNLPQGASMIPGWPEAPLPRIGWGEEPDLRKPNHGSAASMTSRLDCMDASVR